MSKKSKRDRGRRRADIDHLQIARRELAKRNAKLALEHARLHHQASPDGESRELLERAMLARAVQAFDHGNRDIAGSLIDELDRLGVTVGEVATALERLRIMMGLVSPRSGSSAGSPLEPPEELAAELADQAILYPQRRSPAYTQWNSQADLVREALRRVERGEDVAAVESLAGISRRSPFAEWRLFVRGLVAHYADDAERVEANWSRLDPNRAAYRIATNLQVFSGRLKRESCPVDVATGQRRLQYAVTGSPVIDQLEKIRDQFQSGRVHHAINALRSFRQRYGQSCKQLLGRMTDLMWKRFVSGEDERSLRQLTKAVPGPPLDPNWYRARALLWHHSDCDDLNRMEDLWSGYIRGLRQCEALSEDEHKIAIALVYQRMASEFADAASHEEERRVPDNEFWDEEDFEEYEGEQEELVDVLRQRAEKHLQDALRSFPQLLKAHRDLLLLYQDWDRPLDAIAAARQLLLHHPDHFHTLLWLANYFTEADMPGEAEPYVEQVSRLRPRDAAVQSLIWHQRMGMLRQLTRKRKFDEARRQLQEVRAAVPPDVKPYVMDLLQATIAYKAKDSEAAKEHLQAAIAEVKEPTAIWLIMHAYSDRFGLSREVKNDFRDRFKAAINRRCESETAGHIASFLRDFVVRRVKYSGLATHQRLVLKYLERSTRVTWKQEDLHAVCDFLRHLDFWLTYGICSKLLPRGLQRFPDDPLFPFLHAKHLMRKSTYHVDFNDVIEKFELALELNKTAELRLSEEDVEDAKTGLAAAQMARDMMSSMMGRLGGFFNAGFEDDDEDWDDEDDDWEDEDGPDPEHHRWQPDREPTGSSKNQRFFPF